MHEAVHCGVHPGWQRGRRAAAADPEPAELPRQAAVYGADRFAAAVPGRPDRNRAEH